MLDKCNEKSLSTFLLQALTSLQAQIHELDAENQRLKEEMDQMQERVEENRSFNHPIVMEEVVQKSSASQEDTGIQDLSAADLTRAEIAPTPSAEVDAPAVDAKKILEENNDLHQRLQEARAEAADLLQQVEQENLLKLSPEIKEKIRDVEEMLEKYEAEELQSDDEQVEDLAATNRLLSGKCKRIRSSGFSATKSTVTFHMTLVSISTKAFLVLFILRENK